MPGEPKKDPATPPDHTPGDGGTETQASSIYRTLVDGCIRVLQLQPAKSLKDPLFANLHTVTLNDETAYEALSYAWDGVFDDEPLLDGQLCLNGSMMVIKGNLLDALRRLRHRKQVRTVWADAVCINQDDTQERSAQVMNMARIYSHATRVVLWVGEDSRQGDGKAYIRYHRDYTRITSSNQNLRWRRFVVAWLLKTHIWDTSWNFKYLDPNPGLCWPWRARKLHKSVVTFRRRRCLLRRWCLQEVAFAKHVLVVCGAHDLSLDVVETGLLMGFYPGIVPGLDKDYLPFKYSHALRLLKSCERHECLDERDRIYALANMLNQQPDCPPIAVDYSLHWTKLYARFTHDLIKTNGYVQMWQLLTGAGIQRLSGQRGSEIGLPSWSPDWRFSVNYFESCQHFSAEYVTSGLPIIACNDTTLLTRLGFFGIFDGVMADIVVGGVFHSGDCLYGLYPQQGVAEQIHPGLSTGGDFMLVLRTYGNEERHFSIVGGILTEFLPEPHVFVAMHDVTLH